MVELLSIYGKDSTEVVPVTVVSLPWMKGLFVPLLTFIIANGVGVRNDNAKHYNFICIMLSSLQSIFTHSTSFIPENNLVRYVPSCPHFTDGETS